MTDEPHAAIPSFTPVRTRRRHDGWSPARQLDFIDALAASGCVAEACATVGRSPQSAYALRARTEAQGFRIAWDAALDFAVRRLSDAVLSRALNGVAVPHYYKGEVVGENRRYDERLAMFLLRYRDPLHYAATLDKMLYSGHPEHAALALARARDRAAEEAHGFTPDPDPAAGAPPWESEVEPTLAQIRAGHREEAEAKLARARYDDYMNLAREGREEHAARAAESEVPIDVPSTSSTSATPRITL